ncbi:MAG TPA: hypothetical protein VKR06_43395 [Ktedonosporobacter sp.]|nr:hypothetical protein [Ktedonosporobacter sp.]
MDYNRKIKEKFGQTALPCVLYLTLDGNVPTPPMIEWAGDFQVLRFDYLSEEVGKWKATEVIQTKPINLWPLLPLTEGGRERERIEYVLDQLQEKEDARLLKLTCIFALYAFDHYQHTIPKWLNGRILHMEKGVRDLPIIRDFMHEEREQGREEGREEEHKKSLTLMRKVLVRLVQKRFTRLDPLVRKQAALITSLPVLVDLHDKILMAKTTKEARQYLNSWKEVDKTQLHNGTSDPLPED